MLDVILVTKDPMLAVAYQAVFRNYFSGDIQVFKPLDDITTGICGFALIDTRISLEEQQSWYEALQGYCSPIIGLVSSHTNASSLFDAWIPISWDNTEIRTILRKGYYEKLHCIASRRHIDGKSNVCV